MMSSSYYSVLIAGATPVVAEFDQPIGAEETMRIRIGDLVLVISPELADDLADAIIEAVADRSAPVLLQ